jgi:TPR repeat protein
MTRNRSSFPSRLILGAASIAAAMLLAPMADADYLPLGTKVVYVHQPAYLNKLAGRKAYSNTDIDDVKELAKLGDATAQNNLGVMLASRGDYKQAAGWYQRAAEAGVGRAAYNLGVLYAQGLGVSQDALQARHWFEQGAKHDDPYAQFQLGRLAADAATEMQWYQKAGHQGLPAAQYNLAVMYHNGEGTGSDDVQAYAWLLAAQRSGVDVSGAKDAIGGNLSSEQTQTAQTMSRSLPVWQALHAPVSFAGAGQPAAEPATTRAAF